MFGAHNAFMTGGAANYIPALSGQLWAWGFGKYGALGLGSTVAKDSPNQVGALTNWKVVNCCNYNTTAIRSDGTLWSWGYNTQGQLGLGNTTNYSSPKQIGTGTTWSKIGNGQDFALAIKTDGTLWSWGGNYRGQLGLGNTTYYSSPKQVGVLTNWATVSAGGRTSWALKTNGTAWGWGGYINGYTSGNVNSPRQVGANTDWLSIQLSQKTVFGIRGTGTAGALWCLGYNTVGQLGIGNTTNYLTTLKQVGALTNWAKVANSSSGTAAINSIGQLFTWGNGSTGRNGLGNTTYYSSPKQVGALTNWAVLPSSAANARHTVVAKKDGTLWAWGAGSSGDLGLGSSTAYSSPKQVGILKIWGTCITLGIDKTLTVRGT